MTNPKSEPKLVGVIHLPALPGAPNCRERAASAVARAATLATREAVQLEQAGFGAVIVENFGDVPFHKENVPPLTVAAMTAIALQVKSAVRCPVGINVLRNDAFAALSIAAAAGCEFIRVNVLSGVAATDQGLIEGKAATLLRDRAVMQAQGTKIQIWADALVKHARCLSNDDLELAIEELAQRAMADAVIVTGSTTGRPVEDARLRKVAKMDVRAPLYLGSGVTPENLARIRSLLEGMRFGVIVGSSLRAGGKAGAPLELKRVSKFAKAWRS